MTTHAQPTWHERQAFARQAIAAHELTPARPVVTNPEPDLQELLSAVRVRLDLTTTGAKLICRDTGRELARLDIYDWAHAQLLPHVEIKPIAPAKRRRTKGK